MIMTSHALRLGTRLAALALVSAISASCGIEKQSAPGLTGPSEFGTSIVVSATPDIVARDGVSQATVVVTVRDSEGRPVAGLPLLLSLSPAEAGVLSQSTVTSGSDGRATVMFTAPPLGTIVSGVSIGATPIGSNVDNAVTRTASVAFLAPPAAVPSFSVSPAAPQRFQLTSLDASATRLDGQPCPDTVCTYSWQIGSEATLTGMVVSYRFQQEQPYVIVLSVTAPSGIVTQTQRTIAVASAPLPVPDITVSPTSPLRNQTVILSGAGSTASNGASIVEYTWDFGNGSTGNGVSATTSYSVDGTYTVRLTIRDSNGLTATRTTTVTVRP
jgi:hypothetical protein